jgi:metal-responsive CopG/Arc/MetJ family transcriptional regulator
MKMKGKMQREQRTGHKWSGNFGRMLAAGLSAAVMLGFTACGSAYSQETMTAQAVAYTNDIAMAADGADYGYASYDAAEGVSESESSSGSTESVSVAQAVDNSSYYDERKLIKTVNLEVETKEFDQLMSAVEAQVENLGGYIESMNTYNGSKYSGYESYRSRYSSLTARIPKEQLNTFLNAVSEAGNITSRSENVQDVTLSYVDLESKKNSLQTEQERLLTFLESAENMEDVITLESRLSDIRYQLESMESQLRTYDNKVDFATVYMDIQEVQELTPEPEEETVWEQLGNGFMDSLGDVWDGIVDFVVWFVVHIPYMAVWAVVIAVIVMIVKLIIRRRKKARQKKIQAKETSSQQPGSNKE